MHKLICNFNRQKHIVISLVSFNFRIYAKVIFIKPRRAGIQELKNVTENFPENQNRIFYIRISNSLSC